MIGKTGKTRMHEKKVRTEDLEAIRSAQEKIYSCRWDEYSWNGERLFPVLLPIERILSGSTARLHTPHPPNEFNVIGTPRSGTKWMEKILTLLMESDRKGRLRRRIRRLRRKNTSVRHFHEGLIDDFSPDQKILFVYRDIRDCIVSGYHYLRNELHPGTMGCTPEAYKILPKDEGIERQLIMYMKYRMPVLTYWISIESPNLVKVRYEDMLVEREATIRRIAETLGMGVHAATLANVVEATSFSAMSGRKQGEENQRSHQRKGIAGDWKNHFTERHIEIFRQMGGEDLLRVTGHEP